MLWIFHSISAGESAPAPKPIAAADYVNCKSKKKKVLKSLCKIEISLRILTLSLKAMGNILNESSAYLQHRSAYTWIACSVWMFPLKS